MKYIKEFRLFESEPFSLVELLELGLIDLQNLSKAGPSDVAAVLLAIIERAIEQAEPLKSFYEYLDEFGIDHRDSSVVGEILDEFKELLELERERLIELLFKTYDNLEQVEEEDQKYWVDSEGLPVIRQFIDGEPEAFISYSRIWMPFFLFQMRSLEIQERLGTWLAKYGLVGVRPIADLHEFE